MSFTQILGLRVHVEDVHPQAQGIVSGEYITHTDMYVYIYMYIYTYVY